MGKASQRFVGVDVSEARLAVRVLPGGEQAVFGRDRRGIAELVAWLAGKQRPPGVDAINIAPRWRRGPTVAWTSRRKG